MFIQRNKEHPGHSIDMFVKKKNQLEIPNNG
jgi:hypothetical protein